MNQTSTPIPGLNAGTGAPAPSATVVQNPLTGAATDYGRADLAKIASDNLKNATYSPTVVSDANIRENTIPNTIASAANYTNPGQATSGAAAASTGGASTAAPGGNGNSPDYSNMSYGDIYASALNGLNGQPMDAVTQQELNLIQRASTNQDAVTQASVQAINAEYNARYAQTQKEQAASTAGIEQTLNLGGSSRYAPISSSGILTSKESYDLATLNNLTASENTQIAQLRQAQADKDYQTMSKQLELLDKTRQEKITLAQNIASNMATLNKDTRDKLMSAKSDAAANAVKNGAPQSVIDSINAATTPTAAYSAAAGYGGGANIDVEKITNLDGSQSIVRVDKNTGKIMGTTNLSGGSGSPSGSSTIPLKDTSDFMKGLTVQGAQNFAKLTDVDKSSVMQLVNGQALLSDIMSSRGLSGSAQRQMLLQKAQAVDPSFSENTNKIRFNFMKDWQDINSPIGKTNNSINTSLGHLADFATNAKALDNDGLKTVNKVANWWNAETSNQSLLKLQTDVAALAGELATVYKNGGQPGQEDTAKWESRLSVDYSKGGLKAVADEAAKLLSSKITASRYQYKTTMGRENPTTIIDPMKKQALIDAGIDPNAIGIENTGEPNVPVIPNTPEGFLNTPIPSDNSNATTTSSKDFWSKAPSQ